MSEAVTDDDDLTAAVVIERLVDRFALRGDLAHITIGEFCELVGHLVDHEHLPLNDDFGHALEEAYEALSNG